ncbi:hypothetical protein RYX36_017715 [Vicia faba]
MPIFHDEVIPVMSVELEKESGGDIAMKVIGDGKATFFNINIESAAFSLCFIINSARTLQETIRKQQHVNSIRNFVKSQKENEKKNPVERIFTERERS